MRTDDDDLVAGEALLRQLAATSDPVAQGEALDELWDCRDRLSDSERHEDAMRLLDQLLAWQLGCEPDGVPDDWAEEIAHTMLGRASSLRELDRHAEVMAQCADLLSRFGSAFESASDDMRSCIANALFWKGSGLLSFGRWLEALAVFDELIAREPAVPHDGRRWVAYARKERGAALEGLGDDAGAADAYAEAIASLVDEEDPDLIRLVEGLMTDQASVLARAGRVDEAIAIVDAVISRADPSSPVLAVAYLRKAEWLADRGDLEATIANADAVAQRLGQSDDARLRWCVAHCLHMKIVALRGLGRRDAAIFAAEGLVERFGADLDPRIEQIVAPYAHRLGRGRSRLRLRGF